MHSPPPGAARCAQRTWRRPRTHAGKLTLGIVGVGMATAVRDFAPRTPRRRGLPRPARQQSRLRRAGGTTGLGQQRRPEKRAPGNARGDRRRAGRSRRASVRARHHPGPAARGPFSRSRPRAPIQRRFRRAESGNGRAPAIHPCAGGRTARGASNPCPELPLRERYSAHAANASLPAAPPARFFTPAGEPSRNSKAVRPGGAGPNPRRARSRRFPQAPSRRCYFSR